MALSKDWREFLELLNSRAVDYVIVDAQSLAFHPDAVGTSHRGLGHPCPSRIDLLTSISGVFTQCSMAFPSSSLAKTH